MNDPIFDHDRLDVYRLSIEYVADAPSLVDLTFVCSPLSCNHIATDVQVNSHCLIDTLEDAISVPRVGSLTTPNLVRCGLSLFTRLVRRRAGIHPK